MKNNNTVIVKFCFFGIKSKAEMYSLVINEVTRAFDPVNFPRKLYTMNIVWMPTIHTIAEVRSTTVLIDKFYLTIHTYNSH